MDSSRTEKVRAEKCVKSQNFKLAQLTYQRILDLDPQDIESRTNLRAVNLRLLSDNKNKVSSLKTAPLSIKVGMAGKNHSKIISLTEKLLGFDPKNSKMLMKQGQAAMELQFYGTAIFCFDASRIIEPKSIEPLRNLALAYSEKDGNKKINMRKAVDFAQKMRDLEPANKDATSFSKSMDAALAQLPFTEEKLEDALKDEDETSSREKSENLVHTDEEANTAIKQLEQDAILEPKNPNIVEKIGDLYARIRNIEKAKEAYDKSFKINPANISLLVKMGDLEINRITWKIQEVKTRLKKSPDNADIKKEIKVLEVKRHKLSVIEFQKRVEKQPTANNFKFELGKLYFAEKRTDDAIQLFQTSSKEPKFRNDSLTYLGKLFARRGDYELAIGEFDEVLKVLVGFDRHKKDTLYCKADALEKSGKFQEAKSTFQKILVEDIKYKDVSTRVESLKEKIIN
ncbi:MAG: hypothetical protein COA79_00915 [Planctomycetota bacterium]|nr:MAG: hypothetical protein COA79_00915 [Planctomycetota bacterium]